MTTKIPQFTRPAWAVTTLAALALAVSAPATHASPGGAGTLYDWIATVCEPGTFADGGSGGGPVQPHATWHGGCVASEDAKQPIFVGRYASRSDAEYDVTHMSDYCHTKNVVGSTTATQMSDGTGIVFTAPRLPESGPVRPNVLFPLTGFGFLLQAIPPQA